MALGDPTDPFAPPVPLPEPDVAPWPPPEWEDLLGEPAATDPLAIGPGYMPEEEQPGVPAAEAVQPDPWAAAAQGPAVVDEQAFEDEFRRFVGELEPTGTAEPDPWAPDDAPAVLDEDRLEAGLRELGRAIDPRAPEMPLEYASAEEMGLGLAEVARRDPVAYEAYAASEELKRQTHLNNLAAQELEADTTWRQRNVEARQAARKRAEEVAAQVDAEARELSADGGFWASRSTGQRLAAFVSAIVGGLVQGRAGGPNIGLQMIDREIDRHVAAQRARLADRRSAVSKMFARVQDDYTANEAMRLAAWRGVEARLMAEQQNYDPRGTTARKYAEALIGARARMGEIQRRLASETEERAYRAAKFELDRLKAAADIAKTQAETAKLRRQGAGGAGAGVRIPRAEIVDRYGFDPGRDLTDKEIDRELERLGRAQNLGKEARAAEAKRADDIRKYGLRALKNKDGSTPLVGDEETRREVEKAFYAAEQIVDITDEILAIRDKVGGESSWGNSDAYQRLRVLQERLLKISKAGTQGMSSDADMDVLREAAGAKDVTSFRARAAGLEKARERTITELNSMLRKRAGYDGPAIKFENRFGKPTATPSDAAFKDLLGERFPIDRYKREVGGFPGESGYVRTPDGGTIEKSAWVQQQLAKTGGMLPSQWRAFQGIAADARSDDPERSAPAIEKIHELARDAKTPAIKAAAEQFLANIVSAAPPELEVDRPRQSTAQDTISTGGQ